MKQKRQQEILSLIDEFDFLTIQYLTDFFNVSEMTIRRDIKELAAANLAVAGNGGIRKKEKILSTNYKLKKNIDEKLQIGKTMATLIEEGDIIFIGAGTTIYYSLKYIPKNYGAILTNSLVSFNYLNDHGFNNIYLTGGEFFARTGEFYGIHAESLVETLNIDKAFLSTNGIDKQNISTSNLSLARIQVKVIENSRYNYILADHTKFNHSDVFTFTNTEYLDGIITDKNLSDEDFNKYSNYVKIYN